MRIIGGTAGGRPLKAPKGKQTRPTADRVKEALFSIVEARFDLEGATVLDLYAGSGALALEALSRGAAEALAVDQNRLCVRAINENAARVELAARCTVWQLPVLAALTRLAEQGRRFDLVLADPPYDVDPEPVLARLDALNLLEAAGAAVLEHGSDRRLSARCGRLAQVVVRSYGDTALSVFAHASAEEDLR